MTKMITGEVWPLDAFGCNAEQAFTLDEWPDTCPVCHRVSTPDYIATYLNDTLDRADALAVVLRCPATDCRMLYINQYTLHGGHYNEAFFQFSAPAFPAEVKFPETIAELSPRFVETFTQAQSAEGMGLTEAAGPTYRKAFEVLLKDYLLASESKDDAEAAAIRKNPSIANLIEHYFSGDIASFVKRIAWLGNDETHYSRRWEEHDIRDLTRALQAFVRLVDDRLFQAQLLESMTDEPSSEG